MSREILDAIIEIIIQLRTIIRMSTIINDQSCTFNRSQPANIGYALLRDKYHRVVLGMIGMAYHRYYLRDIAMLTGTRRVKDGQIAITHVIAAATDTIHHAVAHDMGGVCLTVNIKLDRRVQRDNTQPADDFRRVADIQRTQDDFWTSII